MERKERIEALLEAISESEFKPFEKSDYELFSGVESEDPSIAYGEDGYILILDGNILSVIEDEVEEGEDKESKFIFNVTKSFRKDPDLKISELFEVLNEVGLGNRYYPNSFDIVTFSIATLDGEVIRYLSNGFDYSFEYSISIEFEGEDIGLLPGLPPYGPSPDPSGPSSDPSGPSSDPSSIPGLPPSGSEVSLDTLVKAYGAYKEERLRKEGGKTVYPSSVLVKDLLDFGALYAFGFRPDSENFKYSKAIATSVIIPYVYRNGLKKWALPEGNPKYYTEVLLAELFDNGVVILSSAISDPSLEFNPNDIGFERGTKARFNSPSELLTFLEKYYSKKGPNSLEGIVDTIYRAFSRDDNDPSLYSLFIKMDEYLVDFLGK